jgi:signal transduction histidine kinase
MNASRSVAYTRNALFRGIPRDLLREEKLVRSKVLIDAGEIIFEEGDAAEYCYLVGAGAVQITKSLPDGQQELLATIMPGDFFGELALYDSSPRSARATAAVPTRLARLDQAAFEYLRQAAPLEIASTMADRTIDRVRRTNDRLVAEVVAAGRLSKVGSELSTLSHNLRSPLATIRNASDLLQEWLQDQSHDREQTERFVQIIRNTADDALSQIDHLMARLRGDPVEEYPSVPVDELIRELRKLTAGLRSGTLVDYRDGEISYRGNVRVDRPEFVAVLCNLVKNAIESLPIEGGSVEVRVALEGQSVVFSVSDTGTGIRPDHLPRLFERDFTFGKPGGTGIGLAHARAMAEKHGGRIYVESEVGRGTTVRIRLPRG